MSYAVEAGPEPLGRVHGLAYAFGTWHVGELLGRREAANAAVYRVPTDAVHAVDDLRREIRVSMPGGEVRAASGRGPQVPYHGDAAGLIGSRVGGHDGAAGVVTDVLVNVRFWQLRYLVIEHAAGTVLTDIEWCDAMDPDSRALTLGLPARTVATAPAYPGLDRFCRGDEAVLYRHYTSRW